MKACTEVDIRRLFLVVQSFKKMAAPERNWLVARLLSENETITEQENRSIDLRGSWKIRKNLRRKSWKYQNTKRMVALKERLKKKEALRKGGV